MTRMMRKYALAALALLLAAATGCKVTEEDPAEKAARSEKMYPVHFVADEIETRTAFGEAETSGGSTSYPTYWTENDSKIAVSLNLKDFRGATVVPAEDYKSATFDAEFPQSEVTAPYVFYALSPFSAAVGATSSHGGYHFNILTEQTPLASSCDEGAQVMVASQEAESVEDFSSIDLHFSHVTAYGKLTLKNMSLPEGATVQSIDLTASTPFAGRFYYNFEEGTLEESSSSRTVTILPGNLTLADGVMGDIWFACAPADLGGGTLKIEVNTSAGVLSKTLEIGEGKLAFKTGRVSKFAVNMTNAQFTPIADRWVLVTDASTLAADDEIIIATSATAGSAYAVNTTQNSGRTPSRGGVQVTISKDTDGQMILQNPGSTVEVLTLLSGYRTGTFYLKETTSSTGRYLYASNNGDTNSLNSAVESTATNSTYRDYASWKITISDNVAVISTYGTVTRNSQSYYRHIRLNGTSFGTYRSSSQTDWISTTSGTTDTYIFRKEAGVDVDNDPILTQEAYGAYLSGSNHVYGTGDQLSREYMNDGTVTFAILSPATFEVAEFGGIPTSPAKGETFTLNYNLISGRSQSDTDYNVTVVKVDGPKVWLSAGGGKGFIVKK